ncbi:hypothetical protein [Actibacterium sp. 188UL27-1]|uniref:hypothetical protein n=1 Tax=Actibacterium sp. 188UL27-1 TaxID=2786961 RepID=UPI00195A887C|nr:hypothetical protein [Actibacterium sp. 188UL27-1]MBM7068103.1 hypothetical protein [Actibacterium sp. 188UL27-1]
MHLMKAAKIMQMEYNPNAQGLRVRDKHVARGVETYLLTKGIVVVPGTNDLRDWQRFNFKFDRWTLRFAGTATRPGASGIRWHGGFPEHAEVLDDWMKDKNPQLLIGHSLGAASAQIVEASLDIPVIAFASPQPKRDARAFPGAHHILNIKRSDDPVCKVPSKLLAFSTLGRTATLRLAQMELGLRHKMKHYLALLGKPGAPVPQSWPVSP